MKLLVCAFVAPLLISFAAFAQKPPEVTIAQISFFNTPAVSAMLLDEVASDVEGEKCDLVPILSCVGERVRDAFQQRGYFKAQVLQVKMKPEVTAGKVSATVVAAPGKQYRLGDLKLSGKKIFPWPELASQITLHPGDILNIAEMRETLANLRAYYTSRGYANVSIVPSTMINDDTRLVTITLDVDPGT